MRLISSSALALLVWLLVAPATVLAQDAPAEAVADTDGTEPADPALDTADASTSEQDPGADEAARSAEDETAALRDRVERLASELEALREQMDAITGGLAQAPAAIHNHRLPEAILFAGEAVPLDRWDVAERLEREFYTSLGSPAQIILWLKRSARYFPYIEAELRRAGLPDDLKYVAVVESALLPRAYSWAHASGIWQFIADTARSYGLRVTASWDERRDPARSTAAALAYLRDLHASFEDWPLALAAYNAGEGRVRGAMSRQGVSTYHQLALPLETERYFSRILAAKLILEDPARYGFEVPPEERYSPHATEVVTLRVVGHVTVAEIATAAGSFYRQTKALNPAIMADALPEGRYEVRIPEGRRAGFEAALPGLERAIAARAVQRVRHRVQTGDTLGGIARRYGVAVGDIRQWNPATRRSHIYPG
jgi:soluble lytic murein transglycosylase-like protein